VLAEIGRQTEQLGLVPDVFFVRAAGEIQADATPSQGLQQGVAARHRPLFRRGGPGRQSGEPALDALEQ
jgi:hypothetical protein